MTYLLDTHTFIWYIQGNEIIKPKCRNRLNASGVKLFLSIASVWEMIIKESSGKLKLDEEVGSIVEKSLKSQVLYELPISITHLKQVGKLSYHHRDPFDRLLIAQAITENIPIVGKDNQFDLYGVERIW